jgi:hypothetical protein
LSRRRCLCRRVAAPFLVVPPLPSFRAAGSAFVNALPLPSSSRRHSLRRRATVSAFVVASPLPSLTRRRFCLRRQAAGSSFVVAPPLEAATRIWMIVE